MKAAALALAGCDGDDPSTPLPDDVDAVLEQRCRACHGAPLQFGAPMPLLDWEDPQADAPTMRDRAVWEVMEERVHATVRPMPPLGTGELTAAQLATLDAWFDAGAPPASLPSR